MVMGEKNLKIDDGRKIFKSIGKRKENLVVFCLFFFLLIVG